MSQKNHNSKRIKIAKITKPHGLKGNFYIFPFSDNYDLLLSLDRFYLENGEHILINSCNRHRNLFLVNTPSFSSLEQIDHLRNCYLYIDFNSEGGYLVDDLIGCQVFLDKKFYGIVDCYYPQGISGFLNVKFDDELNKQNSFLVPCQDDFFLDISIDKKEIYLNSEIFTPVY